MRAEVLVRVRAEVIERPMALPPLQLGVTIPDTVEELLEQIGFQQVHVIVVDRGDRVAAKKLSPLTRLPVQHGPEFEFTVVFAGPLPPISYATLAAGEQRADPFFTYTTLRRGHVSRHGLKDGESWYLTLRYIH